MLRTLIRSLHSSEVSGLGLFTEYDLVNNVVWTVKTHRCGMGGHRTTSINLPREETNTNQRSLYGSECL